MKGGICKKYFAEPSKMIIFIITGNWDFVYCLYINILIIFNFGDFDD